MLWRQSRDMFYSGRTHSECFQFAWVGFWRQASTLRRWHSADVVDISDRHHLSKTIWQPSGHACQPCTGLMWCLVATPGLLEKWSRQGRAKFCFMDFILRFAFQRHKAWGPMLWGMMSLCNVSSVLKLLWVYQSVILSPSVAELGCSFVFCFYNWWSSF